jgi:hypothetical protein
MKRTLVTLILMAAAAPLSAQWLDLPMPGIPRAADGTPNMTAPTPRAADGHPDLTGLWRPERTRGDFNDTSKFKQWVSDLIEQRAEIFNADNPRYRCLPSGPENMTVGNNSYGLRTLVQHPSMLIMLYNDGTYRQIFTDGRKLEAEPLPTWVGYSVGHWDGDTLVVESNGYNDKTWLTGRGVSHSAQLRITERYTRKDFGHIVVDVTAEDPLAFETPLHATIDMDFAADEVMLETVCQEAYGGEQGNWSTQVTPLDNTRADVDPEILARYVGTYGGMYLQNDNSMVVTLEDGKLYLQKNGGRKAELVPQSDTTFLIGGFGYVFTVDENGRSTEISEVHVSGAWPFPRVD